MGGRVFLSAAAAVFIVLFSTAVDSEACRSPLHSFLLPVGDNFVFYGAGILDRRMTSYWDFAKGERVFDDARYEALADAKIQLRKTGLYSTKGARMPWWRTEWITSPSEIAIHPDGKFMVWFRSSTGGDEGETSHPRLVFLENGEPIERHFLDDLVKHPKNIPGSSAYLPWAAPGVIDPLKFTYTLETIERELLVFDLRTGALLDSPSYTERRDLTIQYGLVSFFGMASLSLLTSRAAHLATR